MKLSRNQVENIILQSIENSNSPLSAAENILKNLEHAGVVNRIKRTEVVVRKDIECMPYEDEVIVEEFGL